MSNPGALERSLGPLQAVAMVVGTIIGASIFVQPSEITRQMPSLGGVLLAWLGAGVLTLCGALTCAELASAFPATGGVYVFLQEAWSPALGFLWGWAMFWSMHTGIIAALATVFACYAGLNAVYLRVLPLAAVRASTRVAADAADALFGGGGAALLSALVLVSTLGSVNGIILTGPRVYYKMAEDGLLFPWLGALHPRFRTPHRALLLQAIWASVLAWFDSYRGLFTRVIYTEWIFFALMAAGLFRLRRRADYQPAYRLWGYPVVPALFILASMVIVVVQVSAEPRSGAWGLGLVLLGLPLYFIASKKNQVKKEI